MISPKEQVCSLDRAKRLKQKGFSQVSKFYWKVDKEGNAVVVTNPETVEPNCKYYAAFQAHELALVMSAIVVHTDPGDEVKFAASADGLADLLLHMSPDVIEACNEKLKALSYGTLLKND